MLLLHTLKKTYSYIHLIHLYYIEIYRVHVSIIWAYLNRNPCYLSRPAPSPDWFSKTKRWAGSLRQSNFSSFRHGTPQVKWTSETSKSNGLRKCTWIQLSVANQLEFAAWSETCSFERALCWSVPNPFSTQQESKAGARSNWMSKGKEINEATFILQKKSGLSRSNTSSAVANSFQL